MRSKIGLGTIMLCEDDLTVLVTKDSENQSVSQRTVLFSNHASGENYSFSEDEIQRCIHFSEKYRIDITYKDENVLESVCKYLTEGYFTTEMNSSNDSLILEDTEMFRLLSIFKMHTADIKKYIVKDNLFMFKAKHNLSDAQYDEIQQHFQTIS